jgi:transcription elongation GreA/GreB family factor
VNALPAERDGDQTLFITAHGFEQLRSGLETLCTDGRRDMSERLREARQDGHLANNPELYDLLEEQIRLERKTFRARGSMSSALLGAMASSNA